jgi:hypothetical protein
MLQGAWGGDNIRSFEAGWNTMWLRWTSGASGAVASIDSTKRYGFAVPGAAVAPVVHGATGVYVLNLADVWNDLLDVSGDIMQASYSASGACEVVRTAFSLSAKTVTILVTTAAGAAVEPTTGDILTVKIELQAYQNV